MYIHCDMATSTMAMSTSQPRPVLRAAVIPASIPKATAKPLEVSTHGTADRDGGCPGSPVSAMFPT